MKYSLFLILLFVGLSISPALAQKTVFGPHVADDSREFLIDGTCDDIWMQPVGTHYPPYAPRFLYRHDSKDLPDMEARYIVDWLIPNDSTYSPAISVTLRIEYYGNNLPDPTVEAWAFSSLSSQMNDATIISGMSGSPLFTMTGSNGIIVHSVTSGAFLNTVNSAVQAGHLTLAFELPAQTGLFDHFYFSDSTAFQLTIQFQDSIAIKITNVVNNTVDYDLEPESLVRGDLNLFIGNEADYSQLPAFEPAYVMRDWRVLYKHIAETWFTKYDDVSLPCRMKFREWDGNSDLYKVMYLTPEFDGVQAEFQAIADSTVSARHKVKREITYEYDGLQIAFKDPWRVEQTLIGGVPSSQTVIDTYQDQTTPYEPWSDEKSWGVFRNTNPTEETHYGVHYWRYYHYNPADDTYNRKYDADIQEGDLIGMDEIRSSAGTVISPAGSIEVTSIVPGAGDDFREYRLNYEDPNNTMDFYGVYKAHMLTDIESQPTRSSNQRKIDIDPRGVYHLVYESAGEIWYVNSEDGSDWSQEELVSSYIHMATNPSLAVRDSSVYVTYMEDGVVMLKRRYKGEWYEFQLNDNYGSNNGAETTPVVAVGGTCYSNQGDIVVVAWDDHEYIAYNMLYLYYEDIFVDAKGQLVQKDGDITQNTIHNPVYPTITCHDAQTEFTICWREGTDIACGQLFVGGGTCDKHKYLESCSSIPIPNASIGTDTCVFAPSITHDCRGIPSLAYEVKVQSGIYSSRWVNIRMYDNTSQSWNTTVYQIPYYAWTGYGEPISPSLGAHESTTDCGGYPEPGLRVAFHKNWGGGIRVGVIDCQYSEYAQITNGESYPSVVPFASNGSLRETYSAPYQVGPFTNAVRSTDSYLAKQATPNIRMVRDLRLQIGGEFALLGVTDLARRHGNNVLEEIAWHAMPDSLVIGYDGEAHEILYTEPFTLSNGDRIDYRSILYCTNAQVMPTGVSIAIQLRKAADGSLVHNYSVPLQNIPSDTAIWASWSRPLTQVPTFPVYISLGIDGSIPSGAVIGNAKVWLEDQYIPKMNVNESATLTLPDEFILEPNHPNPFNPITNISFTLGHEGHVRLSVFNAVGKEVARLVDEERIAGRYQETFHAENLPSGNYISRLVFGGKLQSQNMLLVK